MNTNFCPDCGGPLRQLDWAAAPQRVQYLTCGEHYFEYCLGTGFTPHLQQVELKQCKDCELPIPYLQDMHGRCKSCQSKYSAAWRLNAEKSSALLEITPLVAPDGVRYALSTSVTIDPYPNECTYGGMWGQNVASTEDELQRCIDSFNQMADEHRKQGMTNIEIKRYEPKYIEAQRTLVDVDPVEEGEGEEEPAAVEQPSLFDK
ncbi:MAG: hypothetical protein A2Y59_06375 [Chloroflexi bacterium RBG_13_52_14]|nr:MAG: hypothetical protein A2Y59_06375 [Chloroflexi bacterium RBG_13_52_14]